MVEDIPIIITEEEVINGTHPLVVIGPNGSGKTRFGADLSKRNDADLISALRNILLNETISMRSLIQARNELNNQLQRRRSNYWEISSEIEQLFSKLLVEDSQSAIRYRNDSITNKELEPELTKIMILTRVWSELYPGREIDFTSYSPKVKSSHQGTDIEYIANRMSDGERVALYLAGRVLDSDKKIIIVDEPEIHFHSQLAVQFWNKLEALRTDCRFVYITHDLSFALSRRNAQYLIIQPNKNPEIVPLDSALPQSVTQSILSAASFSIFARRIVFCEGTDNTKHDISFYSSWFNDADTTVIPVGSCSDVIQCTVAFGNSKIVSGVSSLGIIDSDYWPDDYFNSVPDEIYCLPVHEIENLYCLHGVFESIGTLLGISPEDVSDKYNEFLTKAKVIFKDGILCKQVSERFKRRYERQFFTLLNTLGMSDDLNQLKLQYLEAMKVENWTVDPTIVFDEESKRVQESLLSDEEFLKIMPGKSFYSIAASVLGLTTERYIELIHSSLTSGEGSELWNIGKSIQQTLESYLPTRKL
ncbi:DUF4435 domain-containing protein [Chloroflexota bacterium]